MYVYACVLWMSALYCVIQKNDLLDISPRRQILFRGSAGAWTSDEYYPSDGSVDSSPAHSPCTEWPRNLASLSSRRVLHRLNVFLPRRARRSSVASSAPHAPLERGFFRAARRSTIVATIDPQCLTYCNKSSFLQRIIPMHISHP